MHSIFINVTDLKAHESNIEDTTILGSFQPNPDAFFLFHSNNQRVFFYFHIFIYYISVMFYLFIQPFIYLVFISDSIYDLISSDHRNQLERVCWKFVSIFIDIIFAECITQIIWVQ
jgi:hypothetical protein